MAADPLHEAALLEGPHHLAEVALPGEDKEVGLLVGLGVLGHRHGEARGLQGLGGASQVA